MQTLKHSKKKPSNCQNQELGENHHKCGETISLIIYITVFVLFTYLLSKTEISCYLALTMLKNRNKVYKLIKLICFMADQSSKFNFDISNIERTTKLQALKKDRQTDTKRTPVILPSIKLQGPNKRCLGVFYGK